MSNIFSTIASVLSFSKSGTIILAQGCPNEIFVNTGITPNKVWVELSEVSGIPACHASPDQFDIRIVPHGFVIYVILNSAERKIEWIAKK
jgi:hypothetical protein